MPIYAYKCSVCGFAKDCLQKMSDAPLTDCPSCGAVGSFGKQVTAAGFQLKGSGWYVTDFRNGSSAKPEAAKSGSSESGKPDAPKPEAAKSEAAKPEAGKSSQGGGQASGQA
ncbi:MAG: zinc ribbon domain-containing protein [Limnobacter sp.]|nr:zinc ribbon domain-containing protein [Limnobacter sp.]